MTEFTIKKGKIKASRVLNAELATIEQAAAIVAARPLLRRFVKEILPDLPQVDECTINVRVGYIETARGLELTFRV